MAVLTNYFRKDKYKFFFITLVLSCMHGISHVRWYRPKKVALLKFPNCLYMFRIMYIRVISQNWKIKFFSCCCYQSIM